MKKQNDSPLLKAIIQQTEGKFLKDYQDIFYEEDSNIATLKAIVGELYIYLEAVLNNAITDIYIKDYIDSDMSNSFYSEILDKINISRKINVLLKSKKFDVQIIKKAFKITDLRNDLLHFKKKTPLYGKEKILENKFLIKKVVNDFISLIRHVAEIKKQHKNLSQQTFSERLSARRIS